MQERIFVGELNHLEYFGLAKAIHGKINDRPFAGAGEGRWLCLMITWNPRTFFPWLPLRTDRPGANRDDAVGDVEVTLQRVDRDRNVVSWTEADGSVQSIEMLHAKADFAPHLAKLRDVTPSRWQRVREEAALWWAFVRRHLQLRRVKGVKSQWANS